MEEEINYSTVIFKDRPPPLKENKEDSTIYSDIKTKEPVAAGKTDTDGEAAALTRFRVFAVCLGILCVLLVVSISTIIYIMKANLRNLTAQNQQLITERSILQRETDEMSRVADNLNRTLGFILKFQTFPVNEYCPEEMSPRTILQCRPCHRDWIPFQEKCYLFYENRPWRSWTESRKYCRATAADLVVIESLREQEFISNHIENYYDIFHGYWLGLYKPDGENWVWVDGHNDTLGYWMSENLGTPGPHGLMIAGRNLTASWDPAESGMRNRFICESEALIRSD